MATQQAISAEKLSAKVGTSIDVLVDSVTEDNATGRSASDAPEIDGIVHLQRAGKLQPGDLITATVTAADDYDLWAS